MAAARERRSNAGNRLARLLDEEEQDDFYKSSYGGFDDEEQDDDFHVADGEGESDEVDSDFSAEELDVIVISSDEEDEMPRKKINRYQEPKAPKPLPKPLVERKKTPNRKLFITENFDNAGTSSKPLPNPLVEQKETPQRKQSITENFDVAGTSSKPLPEPLVEQKETPQRKQSIAENFDVARTSSKPLPQPLVEQKETPQRKQSIPENFDVAGTSSKPLPQPLVKQIESQKRKQSITENFDYAGTSFARKSIRLSTMVNSLKTLELVQERDRKIIRKPLPVLKMPTQAELLEEAKLTEIENLKSLEKYENLELARKQLKPKPRVSSLATVKFVSKAYVDEDSVNINTDGNQRPKYFERTTITVNDPQEFERMFPKKVAKPIRPPKKCAFTNEYARYYDPVTNQPYKNKNIFSLLRSVYTMHLQEHLEENSEEHVEENLEEHLEETSDEK